MALKVKNIYKYLEAVARWLKLAKDERELLAKSSPVKHVESPRQLFIYMLTVITVIIGLWLNSKSKFN